MDSDDLFEDACEPGQQIDPESQLAQLGRTLAELGRTRRQVEALEQDRLVLLGYAQSLVAENRRYRTALGLAQIDHRPVEAIKHGADRYKLICQAEGFAGMLKDSEPPPPRVSKLAGDPIIN